MTRLTFHGVDYIINSKKSKISRFFWTFSLILSILGCSFYIYEAILKLNFDPQITMKILQRSMKNIPFPAITICSPVITKRSLANFRDKNETPIKKIPANECKYILAQQHWCQHPDIQNSCPFDEDPKDNVVKLMNESALDVKEVWYQYADKKFVDSFDTTRPTLKKIDKILTDRGFCYTTNMQGYDILFNDGLSEDFDSYKRNIVRSIYYDIFGNNFETLFNDTEHWSVERGYPNSSLNDDFTFPVRATNNMLMYPLVALNQSESSNFCLTKEFSIIPHLPNEIPTPFHRVYPLPYSRFIKHSVTAVLFEADSSLRIFSPFRRDCYFEGERKLQFFKSYTKAHCDWECMTNFTLAQCGCVKFSMPRNKTTRVCDLKKGTECYLKAMNQWPEFSFTKNSDKPCDCLSTCYDIKYELVTLFDSELNKHFEMAWIIHGWILVSDFIVDVHQTVVSYQIQNFISDFGGLLGLFMGCSLLSIVEVFYLILTKKRTENKNKIIPLRKIESMNQKRLKVTAKRRKLRFEVKKIAQKLQRRNRRKKPKLELTINEDLIATLKQLKI